MSAFKDLTKRKFERLTVIKRVENNKFGSAQWKCECKCGEFITVLSSHLLSGATQSCGCLAIEKTKETNTTHGMSRTREYRTWGSMISRCNNPKAIGYHDYGARGITICEKWLKFAGFFKDMGNQPVGLTIERIDNNKGYFKENCCWADCTVQARNRRIQKRSKSGITGVSWQKKYKKYQVTICVNYKNYFLGRFETLEAAKNARTLGEQKYWGKNV